SNAPWARHKSGTDPPAQVTRPRTLPEMTSSAASSRPMCSAEHTSNRCVPWPRPSPARARHDRPEESSMTTIRTSHAGALPRTPELIEANKVKQAQNTARLAGESVSDAQEKEFDELLAASVADLVKRQKNLGISLPNDGEYGHAMASDL